MNLITTTSEGLRPLSGDLTGQYLVLPHTKLNRRYQLPRFQIFKATGGFGCKEGSLGSAVFGVYVADNEDARCSRSDFIGIASDELVKRAMADVTPVKEIDLSERVYLVVSLSGYYQHGSTPDEAMARLRRVTKSKLMSAYRCHPETTVNEFGFLSAPAGTQIDEIKLKKEGEHWIVAS